MHIVLYFKYSTRGNASYTSGLGDDVIVCILGRIPSITEYNYNTMHVRM